mgnify:CR=1 FL=1
MVVNPNLHGTSNERKFRIDGGGAFKGTFHPAEESSFGSAKFVHERRLLRTRPRSRLKAGDIFFADRERYLAANHAEGYRGLYRSFRAFKITDHLEWVKNTAGAEDPVTKRPRPGVPSSQGNVWVTMERIQDEELDVGARVKQERYRIITAKEITIGDRIGGMKVNRSDKILGVWLIEAEK